MGTSWGRVRICILLGSTSLVVGCPGDDSTGTGETGGMTATDSMSSTSPSSTTMEPPGTDDSTTDTPTTEPPDTTTTEPPDTTMGPTTEPPTSTTEDPTTGPGLLDFTINFTGYDPHVGQAMNIKVFDDGDTEIQGVMQNLALANDSIIIPAIIEEGATYNVRWWVDLSGNGTCDAPPTDHAWEMTGLVADDTGLTVDHTHDTDWTDVCSFW